MIYLATLRNSINLFLSNPTWDILLLLFFFAVTFIYGIVVGRNRIIVLLLASYPAALINEYLGFESFLSRLNIYQSLFIKAFGFFVLTFLIFGILNKSGFSRKEISKKTGQVIFLSFFNVGLWANIIFGYAMALNSEVLKLAPLTRLLFGSNIGQIIWFIIPIFILYFFERRS